MAFDFPNSSFSSNIAMSPFSMTGSVVSPQFSLHHPQRHERVSALATSQVPLDFEDNSHISAVRCFSKISKGCLAGCIIIPIIGIWGTGIGLWVAGTGTAAFAGKMITTIAAPAVTGLALCCLCMTCVCVKAVKNDMDDTVTC